MPRLSWLIRRGGSSSAEGHRQGREDETIRTLLIDNEDSFTVNLFHLLAEVNGCAPTLVPNDWAQFDIGLLDDFDNVVISPGPGSPENPKDFGICAEVIAQSPIPVLGVCLGHQGLATVYGGTVEHAPEPRHGRVSAISHSGTELFAGIASPFSAVSYHSLAVTAVPEQLEATAWSEDGVIMGLRHRTRPQWGVQFHPESIASDEAVALMRNFASLTETHTTGVRKATGAAPGAVREAARESDRHRVILDCDDLPLTVPDSRLFTELFADADEAIWLDGNLPGEESSRFSIMGAPTGPLSRVMTASVATGSLELRALDGHGSPTARSMNTGVFDWLDQDLAAMTVAAPDLPFDFRLGWVGYLGYELKAEVGSPNMHESDLPDAVMMFLDRAVVIDHHIGRIHLLALRDLNGQGSAADWFVQMRTLIAEIPAEADDDSEFGEASSTLPSAAELTARHSRSHYLDLIGRAQKDITDGETYEVCLTNMLESTGASDTGGKRRGLQTYLRLREDNPAPFGAFIRTKDATILSTSPERFLSITADGHAESKPIKGTRPRGVSLAEDDAIKAELHASIKNRSENLMIVDLVRHDLGRTAQLGSVRVDTLFGIETYATVHQMVSTVSSRLAADESAVSCVRAAFPPGSMTGAPKQRTMTIIDELEGGPRGIYSGVIGYFSLNGAVDLSVVIRTLVLSGESVRYGVGGAIVALSDPGEEYRETVVKSAPLLRLFDGAQFPTGEQLHTVIPAEAALSTNDNLVEHAGGVDQ